MQFLHINESAAWCREHHLAVADDWRLVADPQLAHIQRIVFAPSGSLGLESRVADVCLNALQEWDECLLWITAWEIWPSAEDWPAFYGARGSRGEHGSVHYKPGHLFRSADVADLRLFLLFPLTHGWDAHVLPARGQHVSRRLNVSHDGWVELHTAAAEAFALAAV